jgi:hypothetical protein
MRTCQKLADLAIFLVVIATARSAPAQSSAAAQVLFDKALKEREAGRYHAACPTFAECQRLDPTPGTLFTWAECEAKAGKIATASARYTEYLQLFEQMSGTQRQNHEERAGIAKRKQAELQAEVPTLRLILPSGAPLAVRVTRDGTELDARSLGIAAPVDPGEHRMTTQIPGGPLVEQRMTLERGDVKTLELEVRAGKPSVERRMASSRVSPAPATGGGMRIAGFTAAGLGFAGLVTGSIAGAIALRDKSIVDQECHASRCSAAGWAAVESGRRIGTISTAGFSVGLAGLAGGTVLVFTAPNENEKRAQSANAELRARVVSAGPSRVLVAVTGRF